MFFYALFRLVVGLMDQSELQQFYFYIIFYSFDVAYQLLFCMSSEIEAPFGFICKDLLYVVGCVGEYDQFCCPSSPKLLFGFDLWLGCDKNIFHSILKILLKLVGCQK